MRREIRVELLRRGDCRALRIPPERHRLRSRSGRRSGRRVRPLSPCAQQQHRERRARRYDVARRPHASTTPWLPPQPPPGSDGTGPARLSSGSGKDRDVLGHTAKENRPTQEQLHCVACGHTAHADTVGAQNVLRAGLVRCEAAPA
ncbi:zinc ribbon domain-containing protein [Streptomyces sp. RB17]|uniref:zinc ribbon domain-containing protein n=1 Tax=Streptomyces sp. RB17 TaxID=2585197 RepID=UPI003A4C6C84